MSRLLPLLALLLLSACPLGPRPCFSDAQCEPEDSCVGADGTSPGQCLGADDPRPDAGPPPEPVEAASVHVGGAFACGRTVDDEVYCMGAASQGQLFDTELALNVFHPPRLLPLTGALSVAVADDFGCALVEDPDRRVVCWGSSTDGRLGVPAGVAPGTFAEPNLPAGIAAAGVELGGGQSLVCLRTDIQVWCWGPGVPFYVPGDPQRIDLLDGADRLAVHEAGICAVVGAEVRCLDPLPGLTCVGGACPVEPDFDASAGLVCSSDGASVSCAGDNTFGVVEPSTPSAEVLEDLRAVTQGSAPAVGSQMACALSIAGDVSCWGRNSFGGTGRPDELDGQVCANGNARCHGPLAVPETAGAVAFETRRNSSCALLDDGDLVCWGEFLGQQTLPPTRFTVFKGAP